MLKLRDYQRDARDSILSNWKDGNRSSLAVLPTGCGKTVLFAGVIRSLFPKRAMVLAHRQELIWQARDKIQKVTGLTVDVEMGEYKARMEAGLFSPRASVIVSTIQTHVAGGDGGGRIGKFDPNDFGLLIIDEAHHSVSPSYRKVVEYYMTNPNLVVLGVTATPDRGDEAALGQVFDAVAYNYEILDAIKDGWLVPMEQQFVSIEDLDFSAIKTTAGDLNGADLAAVMESEKNLHGVASATIDILGDRRGLGFASSVNHARILADIFNRHRYGMAECVSAKTDKEERKKIIADFAAGKIQFLWNCGVFTEGFDDSGVEVISMARPTKSRALYAQMAGRATRPHESIATRLNDVPLPALRRATIARSVKPSALVIDFVGNSGKHKLISTADILGGNMSDEAIESAVNIAMRTGKPVRMNRTLEEEEQKAKEIKERKEAEAARKAKLVGRAKFQTQKIDPFDLLQVKPVKPRGWDDNKQLSEKQRDILKNRGYDPDKLEYARAKQLIGIILDRLHNKKCSIKQVELLSKYGYDAKEWSTERASKTIDAIAKNGWRKPENFEAPETPHPAIPQEVSNFVSAAQSGSDEPPLSHYDDDIPF